MQFKLNLKIFQIVKNEKSCKWVVNHMEWVKLYEENYYIRCLIKVVRF